MCLIKMSPRSESNLIRSVYLDASNPAWFTTPKAVWNRVRKSGITLAQVKKVLQGEDAYTLHKPVKKVRKTRKYLSPGLNEYFHMDLMVLNDQIARKNKNKYILITVDAFSRKLYARPLKTKSGAEVSQAIRSIIRENKNIPPAKAFSDRGAEFLNHSVQNLFKTYKITHFTANNVHHAGLSERNIRTLRERIGRFCTHFKTDIFIPELQKFVLSYNNSSHAALPPGMCPNDVSSKNELSVWRYQYGRELRKSPLIQGQPKFKPGQHVRIFSALGAFKKAHQATFTTEKFIVVKVLFTRPYTYEIASLDGEKIIGAFYEAELQLVRP